MQCKKAMSYTQSYPNCKVSFEQAERTDGIAVSMLASDFCSLFGSPVLCASDFGHVAQAGSWRYSVLEGCLYAGGRRSALVLLNSHKDASVKDCKNY